MSKCTRMEKDMEEGRSGADIAMWATQWLYNTNVQFRTAATARLQRLSITTACMRRLLNEPSPPPTSCTTRHISIYSAISAAPQRHDYQRRRQTKRTQLRARIILQTNLGTKMRSKGLPISKVPTACRPDAGSTSSITPSVTHLSTVRTL